MLNASSLPGIAVYTVLDGGETTDTTGEEWYKSKQIFTVPESLSDPPNLLVPEGSEYYLWFSTTDYDGGNPHDNCQFTAYNSSIPKIRLVNTTGAFFGYGGSLDGEGSGKDTVGESEVVGFMALETDPGAEEGAVDFIVYEAGYCMNGYTGDDMGIHGVTDSAAFEALVMNYHKAGRIKFQYTAQVECPNS